MTEAHVLVPGDRIIIGGQPVTVTAVHTRVYQGTDTAGLLVEHKPSRAPGVRIDWVGDERLPDGSPRVLGCSVRRCSAEIAAAS